MSDIRNDSFHVEYVVFEGREYAAGNVLLCQSMGAWGDHLILGFTAHGDGRTMVSVARPYAYASSVGTSGPTVLLGVEKYSLPIQHLKGWLHVGNGGFRT